MRISEMTMTLLLLALLAGCATAPVRDRLPPAEAVDLRTLEGAPFSLAEVVARHEATVLVWWSTSCPCVARYQERIDALRAHHAARGVEVIAIASNADDSLEVLRGARAQRAPQLPMVVDLDARLARALGARSTPMVVLLDRTGAVRFRGWIDNERTPGTPGREAWLEAALEEVLAGRPVQRPTTPAWGCAITRALGGDARCMEPMHSNP
jgi:hypothetical protein